MPESVDAQTTQDASAADQQTSQAPGVPAVDASQTSDASQPPDQALTSAAEGAGQDFSNEPVGATESSCHTYIEIVLVDEEQNPVTSGRYRLVLTDGTTREEDLPSDGHIMVESIPGGTCDFTLFEMIDFGVPGQEVNRSWNWQSSQGEGIGSSPDLQLDHSGGESLIQGEAGSDSAQGGDSPPDTSAEGSVPSQDVNAGDSGGEPPVQGDARDASAQDGTGAPDGSTGEGG